MGTCLANIESIEICLASLEHIVTIFALVVGGYVALVGLSAWKRQQKGHTEYDLIRRLLVKSWDVINGIWAVISIIDGKVILTKRDEGYKDQQIRDLDRAVNEVNEVAMEAEVLWGEHDKALDDINSIVVMAGIVEHAYHETINPGAEWINKVAGSKILDDKQAFENQLIELTMRSRKLLRKKLKAVVK